MNRPTPKIKGKYFLGFVSLTKNGTARIIGWRDKAAAPKARLEKKDFLLKKRIRARIRKKTATMCAKYQTVPITAAYQWTVPKAKNSARKVDKDLDIPNFLRSMNIKEVFTAPKIIEIRGWEVVRPKIATTGRRTIAGIGGNGMKVLPSLFTTSW
ncbi:MAG: hypothetical protein HY377_00565 [Candidatus Blackburnbacteria bacterium]|nr:hypothetical protein [Candidatus Blackburnbacteria bacterium]